MMNSERQQSLINLAKSGKISGMYQLISDGADPFYFDEHSKNALDYAIETDPIKTHVLLIDLERICTCPAKQEILKYYSALAIRAGGDYEK